MFTKRSLSPLIATILLIVVSVILITVVLTWGSSFAKDNLNSVTTLDQLTRSDLSSFIVLDSFSQTEANNNIIIRNLHSSSNLDLIGYKLVTDSNYVFSNQLLYFNDVITITPGEVRSLNIICFPDRDFVLQLVNKDLTYVTLPIKISDYRYDSYCMGRDGVVAVYDMTTIVDDTLIDISGNGRHGQLVGGVTKTETGLSFDGVDGRIVTSITENTHFTNGFSLIAFLKIRSPGEYLYTRIFDKSNNNSPSNGFYLSYWDSSFRFATNINNRGVRASNVNSIIFDNWNLIIFTVTSDSKINFYVNGVLSGSADQVSGDLSLLTTANPLIIGDSYSQDRSIDAEIKDVKIYSRVLSQKEISDYHSIIINPLE